MEKGYVIFNGESSLYHDVYVSGNATYDSPQKEYKKVSVPGRSGDLLIFNGRYQNIQVVYRASIIPSTDYESTVRGIKNWLFKDNGYLRLEDSYHPDEYRLALFTGPLNITTLQFKAGAFNLAFDCKPQRYLKMNTFSSAQACIDAGYSTQEQINYYKKLEYNGGTFTVVNPTSFESLPRFEITGYGNITFEDEAGNINTVTIKPNDKGWTEFVLDSETLLCLSGTNNANAYFIVGDFPTFKAGSTKITCESTITKVDIYPRWWRI